MNITHDMSNDLTEYDPESRQVDGPNPIENRISSSAARVPDIISCTSGITVQGRQLHSFAFTTDAAIIRNTNADAILAVYPFTGEPVITQALLTAAQAPLFVGVGGGTTTGPRVIQLAMMAEMQGAAGVVLNAPAPPSTVYDVARITNTPVIATVLTCDDELDEKIEAGASIINDVSGFRDPAMVAVAQRSGCGCVVMHMAGEPKTMQENPTYVDVVAEVRDYLRDRAAALEAAGIDHSRICIDPGPGFGKTPKQTIELMRNLHELVHLGYPVMVAASRKSYVSAAYKLDGADMHERDVASAAEALLACELGSSVVRTHNVEMTVAALKDLRPAVLLGLGSNVALVAELGEETEAKIAQINLAVGSLCSLPDTQIVDMASFYESEPAYYTDQDAFVNTVVMLRTGLPPKELLGHLHGIENSLGRVRTVENGPRTLDLDILDYQMYVASDDELTLPHPRVAERDFVVKPLLEILPGWELADGTPVNSVPEDARVGKARRL